MNEETPPISTKRTNQKKQVPIVEQEPMVNVQQPMNFSFSDFSKLLSNSNGAAYYEITFPSLGKSYKFKQLTVGQQRAISKNSENYKDRETQTKMRLALLKEVCLDDTFDPYTITWPEFVLALAQIRENNFLNSISWKITCTNKENCDAKFDHEIDLTDMISQLEDICTEQTSKNNEYSFSMGDIDITFVCNFPTVKKYLAMLNFANKGSSNEVKMDNAAAGYTYAFINQIKVNGQNVTDEKLNDLTYLVNFIDNQLKFDFASFTEYLDKTFEKFIDCLKVKIPCPKCGNVIEETFDIDDFFTV